MKVAVPMPIPLVRLGGTLVRLDVVWALVLAAVAWGLASGRFPHLLPMMSPAGYWTGGVLAVGLLLASISLHELAHVLVASLYGVRGRTLTLHVLGGAADVAPRPPHPLADALVAVVGVLVSLAAGAGALVTRHAFAEADWAAVLWGYLALVNLTVALVNMLPAFPFDGGRLLRALLWWWTGDRASATTTARRAGRAVAVAMILLGAWRLYVQDVSGGSWLIALGGLVGLTTRSPIEASRVRHRAEPARPLDRVA